MIEIFNIVLSLLVLLIISSSPFSSNFYKKKLSYAQYSFFDRLSLNFLFNTYILLFISFTNINYSYFFIFLILSSLIINYFYSNKNYFHFLRDKNNLFFLFANVLIFFYIAADPTLSWDGLENWYFKAQNFFYNYNFFDLKNIPGLDYYPHLGTFLWGFFWKNSLLQYEYLGRFVNIFIFLLSIFSITSLLSKDDYLKPIITALLILLCFDVFLFRGYQEILVFSFFIFISKYFYLFILNKNKFSLLVCFLFLNILPWLKNEGYIFVFIFTLSLLFLINKIPKKKEVLLFIFLSWVLIAIKKFIFFKFLNLNMFHASDFKFSLDLYIVASFFLLLAKGFVVAFFKYKIYIFLLISFLFLFKTKNIQKQYLNFINFLKINLLLYVLMIIFIYLSIINDPRGINWWIDNSLDRILYEISGFFLISIILIINLKKNYILK